jgi:hypothetical protein
VHVAAEPAQEANAFKIVSFIATELGGDPPKTTFAAGVFAEKVSEVSLIEVLRIHTFPWIGFEVLAQFFGDSLNAEVIFQRLTPDKVLGSRMAPEDQLLGPVTSHIGLDSHFGQEGKNSVMVGIDPFSASLVESAVALIGAVHATSRSSTGFEHLNVYASLF